MMMMMMMMMLMMMTIGCRANGSLHEALPTRCLMAGINKS